jgi:hypothetical protein
MNRRFAMSVFLLLLGLPVIRPQIRDMQWSLILIQADFCSFQSGTLASNVLLT